jgi:hypothetical protein
MAPKVPCNDFKPLTVPDSAELLAAAAACDPPLRALLAAPCAPCPDALRVRWVTRREARQLLALLDAQGPRLWPEHPLVGAAVAYHGPGGARRVDVVAAAGRSSGGGGAPGGGGGWLLVTRLSGDAVPLSGLAPGAAPLLEEDWAPAWEAAAAAAAGAHPGLGTVGEVRGARAGPHRRHPCRAAALAPRRRTGPRRERSRSHAAARVPAALAPQRKPPAQLSARALSPAASSPSAPLRCLLPRFPSPAHPPPRHPLRSWRSPTACTA